MGSLCTVNWLEGGIYEFCFTQSSRAAVDEWLELVHQTLVDNPRSPGHIELVLFDSRQSGPQPILYAFQRIVQWYKVVRLVYDPSLVKSAYLYRQRDASYGRIMRQMMNVFMPAHFQQGYFAEDRDAAIAWLLKD
jgi:hypothetical protein